MAMTDLEPADVLSFMLYRLQTEVSRLSRAVADLDSAIDFTGEGYLPPAFQLGDMVEAMRERRRELAQIEGLIERLAVRLAGTIGEFEFTLTSGKVAKVRVGKKYSRYDREALLRDLVGEVEGAEGETFLPEARALVDKTVRAVEKVLPGGDGLRVTAIREFGLDPQEYSTVEYGVRKLEIQ